MPTRDIVVVGASAGGLEALTRLVRHLPEDVPLAMFVVVHVPPHTTSMLPNILSRAGPLAAIHPVDQQEIRHGQIYVAPPDRHLLIRENQIRLVRGPKENRSRPAIDPLFRSAARWYGSRVVGVVLSGSLDDGAAGLQAVKMRGGVAIVQEPSDALFASMPNSALDDVEVDHVLPASEIGPLLVQLAREHVQLESSPATAQLKFETQIAELDMHAVEQHPRPGTPSSFACPECNGTLWELTNGDLPRFRCRVGHAYTADSLMADQTEAFESTLWAALRALEERASLAQRLTERSRAQGRSAAEARFKETAVGAEEHAEVIRKILVGNGHTVLDPFARAPADADTIRSAGA